MDRELKNEHNIQMDKIIFGNAVLPLVPADALAAQTRRDAQVRAEGMRAAYLMGRREWCPAAILADNERTERDWERARIALAAQTEEAAND